MYFYPLKRILLLFAIIFSAGLCFLVFQSYSIYSEGWGRLENLEKLALQKRKVEDLHLLNERRLTSIHLYLDSKERENLEEYNISLRQMRKKYRQIEIKYLNLSQKKLLEWIWEDHSLCQRREEKMLDLTEKDQWSKAAQLFGENKYLAPRERMEGNFQALKNRLTLRFQKASSHYTGDILANLILAGLVTFIFLGTFVFLYFKIPTSFQRQGEKISEYTRKTAQGKLADRPHILNEMGTLANTLAEVGHNHFQKDKLVRSQKLELAEKEIELEKKEGQFNKRLEEAQREKEELQSKVEEEENLRAELSQKVKDLEGREKDWEEERQRWKAKEEEARERQARLKEELAQVEETLKEEQKERQDWQQKAIEEEKKQRELSRELEEVKEDLQQRKKVSQGLEHILENSPFFLFHIKDDKVSRANRSFYQATKWEPSEVKDSKMASFLATEEEDRFSQLLSSQSFTPFEKTFYSLKTKEGEKLPVEFHLLPSPEESPDLKILVGLDMSDYHELSRSLEEKERTYEKLEGEIKEHKQRNRDLNRKVGRLEKDKESLRDRLEEKTQQSQKLRKKLAVQPEDKPQSSVDLKDLEKVENRLQSMKDSLGSLANANQVQKKMLIDDLQEKIDDARRFLSDFEKAASQSKEEDSHQPPSEIFGESDSDLDEQEKGQSPEEANGEEIEEVPILKGENFKLLDLLEEMDDQIDEIIGSNILEKVVANELEITTDKEHLKDLLLDMLRYSAKHIESGNIVLRAEKLDREVVIAVEDDGPLRDPAEMALLEKEDIEDLPQGLIVDIVKKADYLSGEIEGKSEANRTQLRFKIANL